MLSPGFLQTGRNFYEQVALLNKDGHDVIVMDHQWAGYTSGKPGGIDRGFGIARDVGAVAALAHQVAQRDYPESPHQVAIVGTSMGAGTGALGAIVLNDAGKLRLEGPQMPKGLPAVLQAPYFEKTSSLINNTLSLVGMIPLVKNLAVTAVGLPILTDDATSMAKLADHTTSENVVARTQAFNASRKDLQFIRGLIDSGQGPHGRVYFIHAEEDRLARPAAAREVAEALGPNAHFKSIPGKNHVFEENPAEQGHVLEGVRWVAQK